MTKVSAVIYHITKAHRKNGDKPSVQDEFLSGFYKTDKLLPVITLTVYLDAKEWDAPRSLHEMLFMKDEELLKFIPDYKLNLITPADISDMDFSKFHTELSPVLKYLKYSRSKEKLSEIIYSDPAYRSISRDSAEMINIVTNSAIRLEQGKERIDMCKALEDIRADERAEGKMEGMINTLISLFKKGILTLSQAAEEAKMSPEEFQLKAAEQK